MWYVKTGQAPTGLLHRKFVLSAPSVAYECFTAKYILLGSLNIEDTLLAVYKYMD